MSIVFNIQRANSFSMLLINNMTSLIILYLSLIATMEKVHKESQNKEKLDETNQPQSIAERFLQQCLIPVPVQPLQASSKHVNPTTTNNI